MKTGYLITARLKSQRLKKKILLDIDGDTVLDKVIQRCKAVQGVDEVILCTSTNPQDEELIAVAKKHSIKFFRGSEDDVLQRLLDAARQEKIDNFLSITADNPLHSVKAAQEILNFNNGNDFDFIFTKNLPIGLSPNFVKTDALDVAVFMKKKGDTEIWGPFVDQPDFFKIGKLFFKTKKDIGEVRITCDYEQDYLFIKEIYQQLKHTNMPDINRIIELYQTTPDIFNINRDIIQRSLKPEVMQSINKTFIGHAESGLLYAKNKGIVLEPKLISKEISI